MYMIHPLVVHYHLRAELDVSLIFSFICLVAGLKYFISQKYVIQNTNWQNRTKGSETSITMIILFYFSCSYCRLCMKIVGFFMSFLIILLLVKNFDLPLITLMIFQLNEMHNCGKYHLLVLEEEKTAHKFLLEKINQFVSFHDIGTFPTVW